jgi:hypothetical protein
MIHTFLENNKLWANTTDLLLFEENPREIKPADFDRLLAQLFELDQYKPSIITPDGILLGGNMRKKGYDFILKMSLPQIVDFFKDHLQQTITEEQAAIHQNKFVKTYVSIVDPQDEKVRMKYNLSDNDSAGFTVMDLLKKIYAKYDIEWQNYSANTAPQKNLKDLFEQFKQPAEDNIPAVSEDPPLSQLGEIYQLGNHRVMVGEQLNKKICKN